MSDTSSKNRSSVVLMRWIARIVSIPWGYGALAVAWFVAGNGYEEGMSLGLYMTIVFIAFVLSVGASIIAAVWGMEVLGGTVLLADFVLIMICFAVSPQLPAGLLFILLLPPLSAGALFLACHSISKNQQAS